MYILVVLFALTVAVRTEAEITGIHLPTSYWQDIYQLPLYNHNSQRKRSAVLFNVYRPELYREHPHPPHSSLFSRSTDSTYKRNLQKRSISFEPPKSYAAATPYAPSFYAPPTIPFTLTSPLLPRGPYVSAYTAPAHYIQKRLTYMAPPFATLYPSTVIGDSPGAEYAVLNIIQKRDIMELKQS